MHIQFVVKKEYYDLTLIVNVAAGIADTSTVTTAGTANACNAPRMIPHGNVTYSDAMSFPPREGREEDEGALGRVEEIELADGGGATEEIAGTSAET